MAGDQRTMLDGSMLMLHRSSGMTMGNTEDHAKTAKTLAKIDRQVTGIYAKVSGLPAARIEKMLDEETWLDASQAVELGLATAASVEAVSAQIAAFLDQLTHFRNTPATIVAMAKMEAKMPTPNTPAPAADVAREIFMKCKAAGLDMNQTDDVLAKCGDDSGKAKDMIIDMIAARAGDQRVVPGDPAGGDVNPIGKAAEEYLFHRMTSTPIPADSPAVRFQGRSLLDVGAMLIEANGGRVKSWFKDRLASQIMAPTMVAGGTLPVTSRPSWGPPASACSPTPTRLPARRSPPWPGVARPPTSAS